VSRDPKAFRNFIGQVYNSKDREDPFTHFYLKEGGKTERAKKLIAEEKQNQIDVIEDDLKTIEAIEEAKERRERLWHKVENMLLENEIENEDLTSVSHALRTNIKVNYDLKTLMKSEFIYDAEPDLNDSSVTNEQFMDVYRRRAESRLIKTKIVYKLYQGEKDLTPKEKKYLNHWVTDLRENP
jgi:hypothetical protein